MTRAAPLYDRFWAKVPYGGPNECWLWKGCKCSKGYGSILANGHYIGAHRVAWYFAHNGVWPTLHVLHTCDTPACVNPAHLIEGSNDENMRDKARKGRAVKGVKSADAKLTPEQVIEIRWRHEAAGEPFRQLAQVYGVGTTTIRSVCDRSNWRHIG